MTSADDVRPSLFIVNVHYYSFNSVPLTFRMCVMRYTSALDFSLLPIERLFAPLHLT